jgi:hypothetical protein
LFCSLLCLNYCMCKVVCPASKDFISNPALFHSRDNTPNCMTAFERIVPTHMYSIRRFDYDQGLSCIKIQGHFFPLLHFGVSCKQFSAMTIKVQTYPVMPSRPCSFCLCLQGGSVFADFDTDDANMISLRRISFDGYGCCRVGESSTKMSSGDSRLLLDAISRGHLESVEVKEVLRRYFCDNKDVIWRDALADHDLL